MNYYIRSFNDIDSALIEKIMKALANEENPAEYFKENIPCITAFNYDTIEINGGGYHETVIRVNRKAAH